MLDIGFGHEDTMVQVLTEEVKIYCDICAEEAFIFQEEGNFCMNCWQERTEPQI